MANRLRRYPDIDGKGLLIPDCGRSIYQASISSPTAEDGHMVSIEAVSNLLPKGGSSSSGAYANTRQAQDFASAGANHLFEMPAEIRIMIYEYVLLSDGEIDLAAPQQYATRTALLRTSTQLRAESSREFFSKSLSKIQFRYCTRTRLFSWLESIGHKQAAMIKSLDFGRPDDKEIALVGLVAELDDPFQQEIGVYAKAFVQSLIAMGVNWRAIKAQGFLGLWFGFEFRQVMHEEFQERCAILDDKMQRLKQEISIAKEE